VRAKVEAVARPSVEVVLHVDGAADTLGRTDRPVLLESPGAIDRGLVGAGGDIDIVGAAVGVEAALERGARRGVVGAIVLDHVVLDERVAGPAVDGEVAVALGRERAAVVNGANRISISSRPESHVSTTLTGHYQGSSPCHRRSCQCFSS
jgi:hypothetical protein